MSGRWRACVARLAGFALACLLPATAGAFQSPDQTPSARLATEIAAHTPMMEDLEALCDGIGARMTGSASLAEAQSWAMAKLARYGATGVRLEAYDLGLPWRRGRARARLLNANRMPLDIVQKAWTHGTRGTVRAELAVLDAHDLAGIKAALPAMRGKIVLVGAQPAPTPDEQKNLPAWRREIDRAIHAARLAGVLLVSSKAAGVRDMWGGPGSRFDRAAGIVTREHAAMLRRLVARGVTPRLELELGGGFGKAPVQAHNVVADFAGSEANGEMVIVGAHLDTWDLGSGATDNGSGAVMALEVLRAMQASGLRPRRTLRIVLFSGEEQGLLGSKAYVAAHRDELSKVQAVLVQDAGAGRILGFPDMKVEAWYAALQAATTPARALGPLDIVYAASRGSDHASFFELGVPAFVALQEPLNYQSHTQHTQLDGVDQVKKADLVQAAQVMAITAWELLHASRLPHLAR